MILSTRQFLILFLVALIISIAIVLSLGKINYGERSSPTQAEKIVWPIKLTVSLNRIAFFVGEEVNVTLQLANVSNETITLPFQTPIKFDFMISDESLQTIYVYSYTIGSAAIGSYIKLEPGEALCQTLAWNQKRLDSSYNEEQVGPGTYFVFGKTFYLDYVGRNGQEINEIKAEKIQIEIRA